MKTNQPPVETPPARRGRKSEGARARLLDAALRLLREKGYHGTSVDDLCLAAGVTKGAFFHHFKSKEELAVAAAGHWSQVTGGLFASAPYHQFPDPLERVLAYVDFRAALIAGDAAAFSCLAGTMVQETFLTNPMIRAACLESIASHAATLEADLAEAIVVHGLEREVTAASLALHTQAVLQGAFILAKAHDDSGVAVESVAHLRRYFSMLFKRPGE